MNPEHSLSSNTTVGPSIGNEEQHVTMDPISEPESSLHEKLLDQTPQRVLLVIVFHLDLFL